MAVHFVTLCQLQWLYTLELQGRVAVRDEFERIQGYLRTRPCDFINVLSPVD